MSRYRKEPMTPAERQEVMERLLALPSNCRKCGGSNWYYPPNQNFRICQDCRRGAVKRYKKKKPEVALHFQRKGNLKRFGVTLKWYEARLTEQNGLCAVCQRPETKRAGGNGKNIAVKALAIDHDHTTGQVRDLLCHSCNVALGLLEDDPARVLALLTYLERHGKVLPAGDAHRFSSGRHIGAMAETEV